MAYEIKWIALLSVVGAFLLPTAAVGAIPQLTAKSQVDSVGTAYTPNGNVKIELREVRTEAMGLTEPRPLSVLVIFEPESGAFSWRVTDADLATPSLRIAELKDEQAVFLKDGEIIDFRSVWSPPVIYVRAYRGHASNMDDAEAQALNAASASSLDPREGNLEAGQGARVVSLVGIGSDFFYSPDNSFPEVPIPKVTAVRWDGGAQHWIVTLQARWKAEITLDAYYSLVSMKKVEQN
ncbi:MAG: hypothetical protein ABR889_06660 [Acidobacteriaceae bacterium]|jgi:hypothetical protein